MFLSQHPNLVFAYNNVLVHFIEMYLFSAGDLILEFLSSPEFRKYFMKNSEFKSKVNIKSNQLSYLYISKYVWLLFEVQLNQINMIYREKKSYIFLLFQGRSNN